jgi:hypothetical protein
MIFRKKSVFILLILALSQVSFGDGTQPLELCGTFKTNTTGSAQPFILETNICNPPGSVNKEYFVTFDASNGSDHQKFLQSEVSDGAFGCVQWSPGPSSNDIIDTFNLAGRDDSPALMSKYPQQCNYSTH